MIDEDSGDITTLWHDDLCPELRELAKAGCEDLDVYRVGDVEYEASLGGWTARDHVTGELLYPKAFTVRADAVKAEQEALFKRMSNEPILV